MSVSDTQAAWIKKVLGLDLALGRSPGGEDSQSKSDAMVKWQKIRRRVLDNISAYEKVIRAAKDPFSDAAIIELRAIASNITEAPTTPQQINELEKFISTNDIVDDAEAPNGFGVTVSIRRPILFGLKLLRA